MLNEIIDAKYRFISETNRQPKKVHLSGRQIAKLKNEMDNMMIRNGGKKVPDTLDGMLIIISETDGPSFST